MSFEIIDDFLEREDLEYIINTFFPKDPHNPNNFAWNYLKGIVRDPEELQDMKSMIGCITNHCLHPSIICDMISITIL